MRNERARLDDARDEMDRADEGPAPGAACMLIQTTTETAYPTAAGSVYACQPLSLGGTEEEGDVPSVSADTDLIHAWNIGTEIPPSGTKLLAFAVGGRWVIRYDG